MFPRKESTETPIEPLADQTDAFLKVEELMAALGLFTMSLYAVFLNVVF